MAPRIVKFIRTEPSSGCQGLGAGRNGELEVNRDRISVWEKSWRWMVVMVAQKYQCTKCYWTIHLRMVKMVNFICIFYHKKKQKLKNPELEGNQPLRNSPKKNEGFLYCDGSEITTIGKKLA